MIALFLQACFFRFATMGVWLQLLLVNCTTVITHRLKFNSRMSDRAMSIVLALGGNALLGHVTTGVDLYV